MEFKKKVLVAGAGRSGLSAVKLLTAVKADVILYDSNKGLDPEELKKLAGTEELLVLTGELKEEDIKDVELCVISTA